MNAPETIGDVLAQLRNLGGGTPIDDAWVRTIRMYAAKAEAAMERERAAVLRVAEEAGDCQEDYAQRWAAELRKACGR